MREFCLVKTLKLVCAEALVVNVNLGLLLSSSLSFWRRGLHFLSFFFVFIFIYSFFCFNFRDLLKLADVLKSKNEENEAFLSEIEVCFLFI